MPTKDKKSHIMQKSQSQSFWGTSCINLHCTFLHLIPTNILPRFIVRCYDQSQSGCGHTGARGSSVRIWGVVVGTKLEPNQKLTFWIIVHSSRVVTTQSSTSLQGDEGNDVLLTELNIVNTRHFVIPDKHTQNYQCLNFFILTAYFCFSDLIPPHRQEDLGLS